ncbi:MAG: transporter substrate-binding domain-containing protein [Acidimicrobiia bacterium]|nr:transporter substrate-binding domain-containing protein [Acidimicrobiia bacterium]
MRRWRRVGNTRVNVVSRGRPGWPPRPRWVGWCWYTPDPTYPSPTGWSPPWSAFPRYMTARSSLQTSSCNWNWRTEMLFETMRRYRWSVALLCLLVFATACGGDATTDGDTEPEDSEPATTAATTTAAAETDTTASAEEGGGEDPASLVPAELREAGVLEVAALTGQVPMMFVDEDGSTLAGVEADLLNALGEVLDIEMNLTDTNLDAIIPGIQAERYRLGAGSITDTTTREETVDFVVYASYGQALAVPAGNPANVTFTTACGKRIAAFSGSIQQTEMVPSLSEECEANGEPPLEGQTYPDIDSMFLALESDRADGALLNEVVVEYRVANSDGAFEVGDTGYRSDPKGILMAKDSPLVDAVYAAVVQLHEDGTLREIFDKWQVGGVVLDEPGINQAD